MKEKQASMDLTTEEMFTLHTALTFYSKACREVALKVATQGIKDRDGNAPTMDGISKHMKMSEDAYSLLNKMFPAPVEEESSAIKLN